MTDDLRADLDPADADELLPFAERLRASRPVPRAAFRGDLRRRLEAGRAHARPRMLWARVATSFGAGVLLVASAALGVAGAGPFAA